MARHLTGWELSTRRWRARPEVHLVFLAIAEPYVHVPIHHRSERSGPRNGGYCRWQRHVRQRIRPGSQTGAPGQCCSGRRCSGWRCTGKRCAGKRCAGSRGSGWRCPGRHCAGRRCPSTRVPAQHSVELNDAADGPGDRRAAASPRLEAGDRLADDVQPIPLAAEVPVQVRQLAMGAREQLENPRVQSVLGRVRHSPGGSRQQDGLGRPELAEQRQNPDQVGPAIHQVPLRQAAPRLGARACVRLVLAEVRPARRRCGRA